MEGSRHRTLGIALAGFVAAFVLSGTTGCGAHPAGATVAALAAATTTSVASSSFPAPPPNGATSATTGTAGTPSATPSTTGGSRRPTVATTATRAATTHVAATTPARVMATGPDRTPPAITGVQLTDRFGSPSTVLHQDGCGGETRLLVHAVVTDAVGNGPIYVDYRVATPVPFAGTVTPTMWGNRWRNTIRAGFGDFRADPANAAGGTVTVTVRAEDVSGNVATRSVTATLLPCQAP